MFTKYYLGSFNRAEIGRVEQENKIVFGKISK